MLYAICILVLLTPQYVMSDWHTSLNAMRYLVTKEKSLLHELKVYITKEEARLDELKKFASNVEHHLESEVDDLLANPFNQFFLLKRLAYQWKETIASMNGKTSTHKIQEKMKPKEGPNKSEVRGSAHGLLRLISVYLLPVDEFLNGVIRGHIAKQPLSAHDCYILGDVALEKKNPHFGFVFSKHAYMKIENGDRSAKLVDVLNNMGASAFQLNNMTFAFATVNEISRLDPGNPGIEGMHEIVEQKLTKKEVHAIPTDYEVTMKTYEDFPGGKPPGNFFQERCEKVRTLKETSNLHCYMWDNNREPNLVLSPVKMEELLKEPHVVRFYDVVSDYEIEHIKSIGMPRLRPATIIQDKHMVVSDTRTTQTGFIADEDSYTVELMSRRISHITNLDTTYAEWLAISNYGTGGHYTQHADFFDPNVLIHSSQSYTHLGNRIATFLMYLSEVDEGGHTIFLDANLSVAPIKGSALFWHNLHKSGTPDQLTWHAACPILHGNKWIANKWIREKGQEKKGKCDLDQNARYMLNLNYLQQDFE